MMTMMMMVAMTMIMMMMVVMAMMMMVVMMMMMIMMIMMMMDSYVDKHQMRLYHDSIIMSCVSYSENTFSHRLISFLDGLSCPVDDDDAS
jgi:hypothetical protein